MVAELYKMIADRTEAADIGVKFVDLYNDQFEKHEQGQIKSLRYPAILVEVEPFKTTSLGAGRQSANIIFNLHIGSRTHKDSHSRAGATERDGSLAHLQLIDQVTKLFHRHGTATIGTIAKLDAQPDDRYDKVKSDIVKFRCRMVDRSAVKDYEQANPNFEAKPKPTPTIQITDSDGSVTQHPTNQDFTCKPITSTPVIIQNSEQIQLATVQSGDDPYTAPDGIVKDQDNNVVGTAPAGGEASITLAHSSTIEFAPGEDSDTYRPAGLQVGEIQAINISNGSTPVLSQNGSTLAVGDSIMGNHDLELSFTLDDDQSIAQMEIITI